MTAIEETAWAKLNLALHVTGQRDDGYHQLESLVTFADFGDRLSIRSEPEDSLSIDGEFAGGVPKDASNLVVRARDHLRRLAETDGHSTPPVGLHLEKQLPAASGIGGGSADAAACLRGLTRHWKLPEDLLDPVDLATALGADVPMCLLSKPLIAGGIGEELSTVAWLPPLPVLAVNPLVPVSTPDVFSRLQNKINPALPFQHTTRPEDLMDLLHCLRNDLQMPAMELASEIATVLTVLEAHKPLLQRMSGSGATCFALFESLETAQLAARTLKDQYPQWWVRSGMTRTMT
ncbi:MAG: 4-(cytidine 5'-diphospho)-2-C-methyl-D-erythritol kinase [Pseudomonadota bacterium]